MLIKERLKGFAIGVLVTSILASSITTGFASSVTRNISVAFNNIKLVVEGKPYQFSKDNAGKTLEPFVYNGRTYLPVADVANAVGKSVDWDGTTQTVYLGERPGAISYLTENIDPYDSYYIEIFKLNSTKKLSMGGKTYKTGYTFGNVGNSEMIFNLNGGYNKISGDLGYSYIGSRTKNSSRILDIYLDGKLYDSITMEYTDLPQNINIPVTGVNQLRLVQRDFSSNRFGFGDVIIN